MFTFIAVLIKLIVYISITLRVECDHPEPSCFYLYCTLSSGYISAPAVSMLYDNRGCSHFGHNRFYIWNIFSIIIFFCSKCQKSDGPLTTDIGLIHFK